MNVLDVSAVAVFASLPFLVVAQTVPIAGVQRRRVVSDKTRALVNTTYIVPERTTAVEAILRSNSASGRYANLERREALRNAPNADMQTGGQDKHLRVAH